MILRGGKGKKLNGRERKEIEGKGRRGRKLVIC